MGSSSDDEPDLRVSNKSRSQRRATFLESDPDEEMGKTSNEKPDFNDPEIDTFQMKSYHLFKTSTSKSRSRMRATFLENDLDDEDHEPLPQQQAPLCVSKPERSELYCWPWVCIVSNIQDESMSGGSAAADRYCYWLKKFSKYKPIRFKMFWNKHLQTAQAVLGFDGHSFGFKNAMKFEKSFEAKGQSKNEWYERRTCPGPNPYGWFAREDDYNSRGPVGDYLRRKRQLKTIADLVLESTNDRNALLSEINLKNGNIQLLSACRMFEVKNELRHSTKEEYRKLLSEYRKLQLLARKHSMRVLDEQEMLNIELEEKKKCLDFSAEELKNRETLEGQKLKEEKEKREKEEAVEKVLKLEGEKKKLNTEIEKLKGKMEVMKHMIGDDYTAVQQKINQMDELLQDKSGELEDLEDLNQHLLVKERQSNDKLQEARKALISGLCDMLSDSDSRVSIGIKGMGDIEVEPFKNACMKRYSPEEADIKAVHLCSLWQEKLKNPQWHPFRVVEEQLEVMEDDEMLVQLREEWGDKAYEAVATALKEIQEYNPSGCYVVLELWNFKEKRKASLEEVISHIFKELKTLKRKRT